MELYRYKTCHFDWNKWESLWSKVPFVASQSITVWSPEFCCNKVYKIY